MDKDTAIRIAKKFLRENPVAHKDYRWVLSEPTQIQGGWYFDYKHECVANIPEDQWELFAGAPGFKILSEDGSVVDVGWDEWHRLRLFSKDE